MNELIQVLMNIGLGLVLTLVFVGCILGLCGMVRNLLIIAGLKTYLRDKRLLRKWRGKVREDQPSDMWRRRRRIMRRIMSGHLSAFVLAGVVAVMVVPRVPAGDPPPFRVTGFPSIEPAQVVIFRNGVPEDWVRVKVENYLATNWTELDTHLLPSSITPRHHTRMLQMGTVTTNRVAVFELEGKTLRAPISSEPVLWLTRYVTVREVVDYSDSKVIFGNLPQHTHVGQFTNSPATTNAPAQ